ncbi:hypothetical protein [Lachnoclostridium phytofermentans]|uniref:Uncharacterized protein n=1 Tax=Lachnoclostridium phytofermentans (strain ATCC 700394 / DSM 18823 / ISDg) TaxID=357809 RepID=A9KK40_LACP7|nr:hypothetical protein [Lachnoclostridium phytofermentans]ABX42612.1 hypothetical protein Cphy_2249 [Lachnoclostridium phytofermentans ISDg]
MKRLLSILIVLSLMFTMSNTVSAETTSTLKTEIQTGGILMSASEFRNMFSGDPASRMPATFAKSISDTNISISNIVISGEDVNFIAVLSINNKTINLPVKGRLSSSYKAQHGINSTIIDIPDSIEGYKFLLFEIYNDTKEDNLLVSTQNEKKELSTSPHLKIYLQDKDDTLYLFETAMPSAFSMLDASNYQKANKFRDALWASSLVKHETLELPTDSTILEELGLGVKTRGLNTWTTWVNPTSYYDSFYIGSDLVQCYSVPYVEYRHVNVRSQDSTWAAAFKVAEHANIAGNIYHGTNVFEYRNVKMAFACGDKSTFIRSFQEGRVYDYTAIFPAVKGVGESIAVSLLNKAVSALPYGSTFQTVLGYINTISSANGKVTLGSTGVSLTNRKTTAVGEKLTKYSFEECTDYDGKINIGHYFTYQGVLQYEAASGNTNTVGALAVEFDKFYTGDYSSTPISKNFQLDYSSQP